MPANKAVDPQRIWMMLTDLAGQLGVEVRLETLAEGEEFRVRGGLCRLGSRLVAFIDRRLSPLSRSRQLGQALQSEAGLELSNIYLKPALREFMENLDQEKDIDD